MSEINSFNDYKSKYNVNADYSLLFGGAQPVSTGSSYSLNDYASIKNGSYGKLLKSYYAQQDAEKMSSNKDSVQKSTLMKNSADVLKKSADALKDDSLWEKKKIVKKDEKTGEETEVEDYDWESITKAVKSFVEDYNDVIEQVSTKANSISNAAAWASGTYKSDGKYNNALSELAKKISLNG